MITTTTEYALRTIVFLATRGSTPATTQQIADATKVPFGYLSKVIQSLNRAGLINSQRGLHGGSTLARPADQISVLSVLDAVGPLQRIKTCPLGIQSHGTNLCALHQRLDDAMAMVEQAFRDSTIADLIADPRESRPLCETNKTVALTVTKRK
jgi:Rrf2 family protein